MYGETLKQHRRQSGEGEDQHLKTYDQEKRKNSDNEEESEHRFDVATWPTPMVDDLRVGTVKTGSESYQNRGISFLDTFQRCGDKITGRSRHFHLEWFYEALWNGEEKLKKWMVYSPIKNNLYCFYCKLFTNHSWRKLNRKASEHDNSENLPYFEKWKLLANGLGLQKTIGHGHQMVFDQQKKK